MGYVELHCHSTYSLLDGASSPEELVQRAADLGMEALALTDHNAVYAALRFVQVAGAHGIKPILGAELTLASGHHLTLLARNDAGWRNLCRLISRAQHEAPKGEAALPPEAIIGHTEGLICLSGCRNGPVAAPLLRGDGKQARAAARWLRSQFGPHNFWIELQHHRHPEDTLLVADLVALAEDLDVGYVATNNVHYADRDGHRLHDALTCIRHNTSLAEITQLRSNSEHYLKSHYEMRMLFRRCPQALENTRRLADRCQVDLQYGVQALPPYPTPPKVPAWAYLLYLCRTEMRKRYPNASDHIWQQLEHELDVITASGLANYFLIVWDIIEFARERGIRCQGRGSAANSLVAYLLGISPIDPLAHELVFERFLSDERRAVPDIDVDFQADRREEIIQYIFERYGEDRAAMACTFVTFRSRSALRDIGNVLGVPATVLDRAAKALDTRNPAAIGQSDEVNAILCDAVDEETRLHLIDLCKQLDGVPRHLGLHNGGMVVTDTSLTERVPTEPAAMEGRTVVQWDKEALEDAGLVKIDVLGLRMLSAIAEAVELIEESTGHRVDLDTLTYDDPAVYAMIAEADTVGVFQVESRAQAQVLPQLEPRCFEDIVISISLIRPGPLQGNMVHPYLRRRRGEEPVTYPHPLLEPALSSTLGVILFQEQVLLVARDLAGFTPGQGEVLRRALGAKRGEEAIGALRDAFLDGARARGVSLETAREVFRQLQAFGSYSFARSHAAAFAVLVYQSAWLKTYFPAEFCASLLNHQPMGFWSPSVLVRNAQRHGIDVLPADANLSERSCTVVDGRIRLGLSYVTGLGDAGVERLLAARRSGDFASLRDFCRRTRLPKRVVEYLIMAGALDTIEGSQRGTRGSPRRRLLWKLGTLQYREDEFDLDTDAGEVELPALTPHETLAFEHEALGLSTQPHVMTLYREQLRDRDVLGSRDIDGCRQGQQVRVAGLAVVQQAPPTANGHRFLTLENEDGFVNVIIRPAVYDQCRGVLRSTSLLLIEGTVQHKNGVTNVLAQRALPLLSRWQSEFRASPIKTFKR